MANIKQQKKRIITNEKSRVYNASFKSSIKTAMKAVEAKVAEGNVEAAETAFSFACKKLDKAVSKGILHKNNAARHKSRLSILINSIR
ncbi:MAG TPA: 30S ribosomal protein S20 [Bacilli bacterium]